MSKQLKWYDNANDAVNTPPPRPEGTYLEDRSTLTMRVMEKYSKGPQKGLTNVNVNYKADLKTRLVLATCPEWDPGFPPYNIAKLSGVVKTAGYPCKAFDLNVLAFNDYNENKWDIPFDPWHGSRDWHWIGESYWDDLHRFVKPVLDREIEKIVAFAPDVIGFSLYYCNKEPTDYVIKEIKKQLPNVVCVIGGPNTHYSYFKPDPWYDIVINGEGEQPLLTLLNQMEAKSKINATETINNTKIIRQDEKERFDLDNLPFPDYSDFPMGSYNFANGALCAISRGCIAKCTFCEETHYYKYRQRTAVSVFEEIEHMYYTYGTDCFYFTDSLVNGNLNELRAFAEGIIASDMKIKWTGYARCDGRMDDEYYRILAASGCVALNYGTESGSQEVLDSMDKKVTIEEMEANFRTGHKHGVGAMTNWIIGYPVETPRMFEDSLTFLWRNRNNSLVTIGTGSGFSVGVDTIVGQNFDKFNLMPYYYYDHWITKDFTRSIAHQLVRLKSFSIFADQILSIDPISKPTRPNLAHRHYTIEYLDATIQNEIEFDCLDFDYNIISTSISTFADSLVNDVWSLFHALWRMRGGYKMNLKFNYEWEKEEWGERSAAPINADLLFEIDHDGNWNADFDWNYSQTHTDYVWEDYQDHGVQRYQNTGPVYQMMDFTRENSSAAIRARRLAWKGDAKFKDRDTSNAWIFEEQLENERIFSENRDRDFSFDFKWKNNGQW
tara:strand:- start:2476 stop:4641 length:2166 start_codon:yes stop_codon:yes gene_type:complete